MRDTKTVLLAMLSLGLMSTWAYHLYDKTQYSKRRNEIYIKDSIAVAQGVQDSLRKMYSNTINFLDARLDSSKSTAGKLKGELGNKLAEINRLRTEIASILKKNNVKKEDLDIARRKAEELQILVSQLQSRNSSIEDEKLQISAILDKVNVQVKSLENTNQQLGTENKILTEKLAEASTFIASDVKLTPVTLKKDKELETNQANKAIKFVISFSIQNNIADYENAEVYVVIVQPDGTTLTSDVWESASSIETKNEGHKKISSRVKFEYKKGEIKRMNFSMNADEYYKGTYTLQLYHNGQRIGQNIKVLN
jgi:chromosome segregation ATPase